MLWLFALGCKKTENTSRRNCHKRNGRAVGWTTEAINKGASRQKERGGCRGRWNKGGEDMLVT